MDEKILFSFYKKESCVIWCTLFQALLIYYLILLNKEKKREKIGEKREKKVSFYMKDLVVAVIN